MFYLENEHIKIAVAEKGAELQSFFNKVTATEQLWQADPKVWKRHAPVLFPIVGQIENNSYRLEGIDYKLSQHGFARDQAFRLIDNNDYFLCFELSATTETKKIYPYECS